MLGFTFFTMAFSLQVNVIARLKFELVYNTLAIYFYRSFSLLITTQSVALLRTAYKCHTFQLGTALGDFYRDKSLYQDLPDFWYALLTEERDISVPQILGRKSSGFKFSFPSPRPVTHQKPKTQCLLAIYP